MKKLLVLAAVSAMAMGAQADWTYTISTSSGLNAGAVYMINNIEESAMNAGWALENWSFGVKSLLMNEETAKMMFGGETWSETYSTAETMFFSGEKFDFDNGKGEFSVSIKNETGAQAWSLLVLDEATMLSPGAAYSIYYGTSDLGGGAITIQGEALETGRLFTDSPSPVPEPTSGLLLLLGVAGLALKRKRA